MERMRAVVRQQNHAMGMIPSSIFSMGVRALLMFDDPAQRGGVS